jgi:hypothetical protein
MKIVKRTDEVIKAIEFINLKVGDCFLVCDDIAGERVYLKISGDSAFAFNSGITKPPGNTICFHLSIELYWMHSK